MLILWCSLIIWVALANRPIENIYMAFATFRNEKAELEVRKIGGRIEQILH